jgi:hypothetical protein
MTLSAAWRARLSARSDGEHEQAILRIALIEWREHPYVGAGLMCSMIVLPFYVSVLLKRILDAHAKAEQALKECLARNPREIA